MGRVLALMVLAATVPVAAQQAKPAAGSVVAQPRAVVELFTSQGCASCPPADRLMCDYARDHGVVVLTLPVTCWDYLGWRDTLASEKFTKRQRIYAKLRGARRIYTPQAVVNGVAHMIGSDATALERALTPDSASAATLPVKVDIVRSGNAFRIVVDVRGAAMPQRAAVLLAPFYQEQRVAVEGGENRGRELTYINVVRDIVPLAALLPAATPRQPLVIDLARGDALPGGTDGFAVLVQSGDPNAPGRMLGAASFVAQTGRPAQ